MSLTSRLHSHQSGYCIYTHCSFCLHSTLNAIMNRINKTHVRIDNNNPAKSPNPTESRDCRRCKRKASRARSSINDTSKAEPRAMPVVVPSMGKKRKKTYNDDDEGPTKRMRCSDTRIDEPVTPSPTNTQNISSVSIEERIFEMSSSANTRRAYFEEKYCQLSIIGQGCFGAVYRGLRRLDCFPVAIKHIPIESVKWEKVTYNGKEFYIILEVALMLRAGGLPESVGKFPAVTLMEWFILDQALILVIERPLRCRDLSTYLGLRRGSLTDHEAKLILKQLVDAAISMHSKGVFHKDLKLENVLVQIVRGQPRVRVIDFGISSLSGESPFQRFFGSSKFFPPNWESIKCYRHCPFTVWQLGGIFYTLLRGHRRFLTEYFLCDKVSINSALPTEIKSLLDLCLDLTPLKRATLGELQQHPLLRHLRTPPKASVKPISLKNTKK